MKKKLIYFDNAATSNFNPKCVIKSYLKALKTSANPGRSGHNLSLKNALEVWKTREIVAKHFGGINPENIIFTKNCTEALNIVLLGTIKQGKNVVTTCFEHNSVLRPLTELTNKEQITLTIVKPQNKKFITASDIEKNLSHNTYLVCVSSISNVTGNQNDIVEIAKLCHKKGILFLVDNAQGAGHIKIDMKSNHISYLTFAGHKGFLSPQGIGGLCINTRHAPLPILYGGTGSESENLFQPLTLPESLESGTLPTQAIISLKKGIEYVENNFYKNEKKVVFLTLYLYTKLKSIEGIKIYSLPNFKSGIISFNYKKYDSVTISEYLNSKYNIATRGGLHCAPLTHNFLNTLKGGIVRVSLNFKNTKKQINILIKALKKYKNE